MPERAADDKDFEYVEAVFSRNMQLQANAASYVATGALTGPPVLIAIFSILFTIAYQVGHPPSESSLSWSLVLAALSACAMGALWYFCNMRQETEPLAVADDILAHGVAVNVARQKVVTSMIKNYRRNSGHPLQGQLLLAAALPVATVGLVVFIYALAH